MVDTFGIKDDNANPGFLNLCTIDISGQIILCWGLGAVLCIVGYLAALQLPSTHRCQYHPPPHQGNTQKIKCPLEGVRGQNCPHPFYCSEVLTHAFFLLHI